MDNNLPASLQQEINALLQPLYDRKEALRNLPERHSRTGFWESPSNLRYLRVSEQRHRRRSHQSPVEYLYEKRSGVANRIRHLKIVYLDTKDWVNLRKVAAGTLDDRSVNYREMLPMLRSLRRRRRILCPISPGIIAELMRQTDVGTRSATAALMDELSDGICLRDWQSIVEDQVGAYAVKVFAPHVAHRYTVIPWTRVADSLALFDTWISENRFDSSPSRCKAIIDVFWKCTVKEYSEWPNWIEAASGFGEAFAKSENAHAIEARSESQNYSTLVNQYRLGLLSQLRDPLVKGLSRVRRELRGTAAEHISEVHSAIERCSEPTFFAGLQVLSRIYAAMIYTMNRTFKPHDLIDFEHAALAIPNCHAFICDASIKSILVTKPLNIDKQYKVVILSRPLEIVEYLSRL